MIVLGMQFGHDGNVCVIKDGKIASCISRERESRVKHAIGITEHEVNKALLKADVAVKDIDYIGICSTQNVDILSGLINDFYIEFSEHTKHNAPSPYYLILKKHGVKIENLFSNYLRQTFKEENKNTIQYKAYSLLLPEKDQFLKGEIETAGWIDKYILINQWDKGLTLEEISNQNIRPLFQKEEIKYGFHYPVTVNFRGVEIPAYYVNHHMAHASSCFFRSGFKEASVLTHDGFSTGINYQSGMIYYGKDNEIFPVSTHHMCVGGLYDKIGSMLNLGSIGAAGKLMGLAPYGKPRFYSDSLVGNWYDIERRFNTSFANSWINHCREVCDSEGYDMSPLGNKEKILEPINTDMAASTQKLFEECFLSTVNTMNTMFSNNDHTTKNLCLSGGTALNCPNNSKIFNESNYYNMFIEPDCGDDGLAIGAALYIYHHLYGNPIDDSDKPISAYVGIEYGDDAVKQSLENYKDKIEFEKIPDAAKSAAKEVYENKIIAWFEGGSEAGPRALGHRSIVSNPTYKDNWERVNTIKGREYWRPFAPSVLEEEAEKWFSGLPNPSPYMLFTGQVISDKLPAITHVDGSSRIQSVNASVGEYYNLIKEFFTLSGVPVVMNTSFNGPGEPIVETPEQAILFLINTKLDSLYLEGYRVTKK